MRCVLLAIDHRNMIDTAKSQQRRQCNLGCVGLVGEHGFTKHHAAQIDAVKAPNEFASNPCFYAVSMPGPVQGAVGLHHVRNNPCTRLARTGLAGTGVDDMLECAIESYFAIWICLEAIQAFAQGPVQPEVLGMQHHARIGAPPKYWLAQAEPGEDSQRVSLNQCGHIQRRTRGQQAGCRILMAPGAFHWRECLASSKPRYGDG